MQAGDGQVAAGTGLDQGVQRPDGVLSLDRQQHHVAVGQAQFGRRGGGGRVDHILSGPGQVTPQPHHQ